MKIKVLIFSILALIFAYPFTSYSQCVSKTGGIIALEGEWKFQTDPSGIGLSDKWFNQILTEKIVLPGSCAERGYGEKSTIASVGKLTPVRKYDGPAWYQRKFEVPATWKGKMAELFLERCLWESSVWIDGIPAGTQNSLSVPHIYNLGELKPGKHTLTIRVDNTYKLPIGTWACAITEDTQGRWNGIIGRMELHANDPVRIRNVQVFSDSLIISVENQSGRKIRAKIQSQKFLIPQGDTVVYLPFSEDSNGWDEFAPEMQALTVSLKAGKWNDSYTVKYALRDLEIKDKQFILNGRPLMLRGPVDECVYPLTGYPPMDKESWLRVVGICKSYGFNFLRFHSWCPPEAAFEAGDELGFLFQVELPLWTMDAPPYGQHPERNQFIRDELDRILETYGNHPSFALMAMGNESSGSLDALVQTGRKKDSRRLYRCENGDTEAHGDFFEIGQRGVVGPRTDWDRWSIFPGWGWIAGSEESNRSTGAPVPTFAHEVGQWAMYPDFGQIKKFNGVYRALNYESYRKSLESHHMLDQAKAFSKASGKFSVLLYKDEIEASMRTYPYGGFQILEARDSPGQGTALVGWLDAFWDSKGLITPEEFSRFCAPTVCLLRMPKRIYTTNELFTAEAEIAHYGPDNMDVSPEWTICYSDGKEIVSENFQSSQIQTGRINKLEEISTSLTNVQAPAKLTITLSAAGTSNSWDIWVYPPKLPDPKAADVYISYAFDQETKEALQAGKSVLLFSSPDEGLIHFKKGMLLPDSLWIFPETQPGKNSIPGSFMPVFWNIRLFNQIGTLGILCDPKHPAFAEFPTDAHSNWQWADLLGHFSAANSFRVAGAPEELAANLERASGDVTGRSKAIILDNTPPDFRPILQVIDNYDRNSKLGTIFEARVGKGKLLVCAMDLNTDAANRPAARQLGYSLLKYAGSDKFAPTHSLSVNLLERLLLPTQVP